MKRRIATLVVASLAAVGLAAPAAYADRGSDHDWACVFVTQADSGYCQQNPLPERLPTREDLAVVVGSASSSVPTAPTAPSL